MSKETTENIDVLKEYVSLNTSVINSTNNYTNALGNNNKVKAQNTEIQKSLNNVIEKNNTRKITEATEGMIPRIKESKKTLQDSISIYDRCSNGISGLSDAFEGLAGTSENIKAVMSGADDISTKLEGISSSLKAVAGGAELGTAIMPGFGTAIGAAVGSVANLVTTMVTWNEILNNLPTSSGRLIESMQELENQKQKSLKIGFSELDMNAHLVTGLESLIDGNARVKEGYESMAAVILEELNGAFGTEYQLIDNQIFKNGEAISSYAEMKQSVEDMVAQKKIQLAMQVFEEDYVETLKKQREIQQEIEKRTCIAAQHMEWYENALKGVGDTGGYSLKELEQGLAKDQKQLNELNGALEKNNADLENYSDIFAAYSSGNTEEIEKTLQGYGVTLNNSMTESGNELDTFKGKIEDTGKALTEKLEKKRSGSFSLNTSVNGPLKDVKNFFGNIGSWLGFKADGGVYTNGSWISIPQYANGGLPNHGTMFVAGERGAEIVGHINGRTEVLNRSQIASAIYSAVATAMSQYGNGTQDIKVYVEEGLIVEKVSRGINQHVKQTGSLPFDIPM